MPLKQRSISYTDGPLPKRILVVAHDRGLNATRVSLLESQGYRVESVKSDSAAIALLEREVFDLILLGRNSGLHKKFLDQRLREKYPQLLTLKIVNHEEPSVYPSRLTDSQPEHVIVVLREMLGDDMDLVPVDL
jgi:PleD family two-component response regulator